MKLFRLVFIGAAAFVLLFLIAAAVVFNGSFQTWAVRKALATQTTVRTTVGTVDAGLNRIELRDVRVEQDGVVVAFPLVEADLSVLSAALREKVTVTRLVAKGWTIDFSKPATREPIGHEPSGATPSAMVAQTFAGLFALVELPFDLALDGVQLEGDVILPHSRGRGKVTLVGGGLAAGQEGKFELLGDAVLADPKVSAIGVRGRMRATMANARTFTAVSSTIDATARGEQVPNGITVTTVVTATRTTTAENYTVSVTAADRPLLNLQATLPRNSRQVDGAWQIDVRDTDLAPFTLGASLPTFSILGEGSFDAATDFTSIHGKGRLDATADRLSLVKPELASVGALKLAAEFDLAQRGTALAVEHFNATLASGAQPVAAFRSLQVFSLDLKTRKLVAHDPAKELFGLDLQGVPLRWMQPLVPTLALSGEDLRGELVATTRGEGMNVRSRSPLQVSALSLGRETKPWLSKVDVTLHATADYAPQGWQAEISALTGKTGADTLFTLEAKAGRLAGAAQPVKTTGKLTTNLSALARQPVGHGATTLTAGEGAIDFAASFGATRELQATVAVRDLATAANTGAKKLPSFSTALRADISAQGQITLNVPIHIEGEARKSDLTVAGTLTPGKDVLLIDAQVTSTHLIVDDAKVFAALMPQGDSAAPDLARKNAQRDVAPPWSGLSGTLVLALKRVVYSDSFEAGDVAGTLRIADGALKLEGMRTGLGEGSAKLEGNVTFDPKAVQPYGVAVDLGMIDFDPGPLLRAFSPGQPPTIEGSFQISSRLTGRATVFSGIPQNLHGDFQLTSRGGVFRGLPVSVASIAENTGTLAALIASAGNALSEITRRKDSNDIVSKAQAVSELAKRLSAISYDQLNVSVTREPSLDTVIKDFTLISPEVRLSGSGRTTHQEGARLLDDRLALEFTLRARDQVAVLLKRIGRLEAEADELGYALCTLPLKVNGTLGRPQTGELNRALVAIALEKTGVTDKAADFVERILGK